MTRARGVSGQNVANEAASDEAGPGGAGPEEATPNRAAPNGAGPDGTDAGGSDREFLRVRGLHKSFGNTRVLDGLNLDVAEHSCVVLIGASGSGKSTLLRAIDLLEEVDDGSIYFRGLDIADPWVDANAIRAKFGMVFQSYNLFSHMSVLENVTLAPRLVHGRSKDEAEAAAVATLKQVGLGDKVLAHPDQLSGGQAQRAAIARALVNDPQLLLLDEVTSALDPELVGEVLQLLAQVRESGVSMIVATHEMHFAAKVADQVCFLHQGRIHEQGSPEQVLKDPQQPRTREFLSHLWT